MPELPEYSITTLYYKHNYITLATIYVRPGHPIPYNFFAHISNNFTNYIIMADINFHSRPNRHKLNFSNFIEYQTTGTLHHLPKSPRPISNTTPDIVITSTNIANRSAVEILDLMGSDHAPIKLTVHCNQNPLPQQNVPLRQVLRFDKADWEGYRDYVETQTATCETPDIEDALYDTIDT